MTRYSAMTSALMAAVMILPPPAMAAPKTPQPATNTDLSNTIPTGTPSAGAASAQALPPTQMPQYDMTQPDANTRLQFTDSTDPYAVGNLPELGQPADVIADKGTEDRLGQAILRELQGSGGLWPDTLVRDYVEGLAYHLALYSPLQDPKFSVVIINDRDVNAFAAPGGVVGVNTGLLLTAESEDEVASVLAHELGHLSQRHFARSQEANKYTQWLAMGGLIAGIAAGAAGAGNAGFAAGLSAQAFAAQSQLRYSRLFEQEADRIGMQTLTQAGYDPRAMPTFFLRLDRATKQLGYMPEFLLTHPLTSSRLSDLERRVRELTRKMKVVDPDFRLIQVRLQVDYADNLNEMIAAYQEALKSPNPPVETRYGLCLALLSKADIAGAYAMLAPLLKGDPNRLDYLLTEVDIAYANHEYPKALRLSERSYQLYPDKRSVVERLAQAAMAMKQPERVRVVVEKALRQYPNDSSLWRMLSDAAAVQEDAPTVFRARAEYFFYNDRERAAEDQLKNAMRMAQDNYSLTAQLQKRLDDMRRQDKEFR